MLVCYTQNALHTFPSQSSASLLFVLLWMTHRCLTKSFSWSPDLSGAQRSTNQFEQALGQEWLKSHSKSYSHLFLPRLRQMASALFKYYPVLLTFGRYCAFHPRLSLNTTTTCTPVPTEADAASGPSSEVSWVVFNVDCSSLVSYNQ